MIVRYKLNPVFVILLIFFACVGYLIGDVRGAVWGAVIMFGISFAVSVIDFLVNINKSPLERHLDEVREYMGKRK